MKKRVRGCLLRNRAVGILSEERLVGLQSGGRKQVVRTNALTPAMAESEGQPVKFDDVIDRQGDELLRHGLPSKLVERLGVTADHAPRRS